MGWRCPRRIGSGSRTGVDVCHRLPCHLHKGQEVEFLRAAPAVDPVQEIQVSGHLGQDPFRGRPPAAARPLQRPLCGRVGGHRRARGPPVRVGCDPAGQGKEAADKGRPQSWCGRGCPCQPPRVDKAGLSPGPPPHVPSQQRGLPEQVACRWGPHSTPSCDPAVLGTPWVLVLPEASELPRMPGLGLSPPGTWSLGRCPPWAGRIRLGSSERDSAPFPLTCGASHTAESPVWYRENVSHHNPEGSSWSLVDTPGEAVQISCGPHDLLWVTLWEGQALVREGINRNNPKGSSWSTVEPPTSENGILHVSTGVCVVWAVTKDRKVWFRRGINSHNPCGTSWIEMFGEMMMVNVGLNDQVWGIGCVDRALYFRQGVTQSELSGKMWKAIVAGREGDRSLSGSSISLLSAGCFFGNEVRSSAESCGPGDTDASWEVPGPASSPARLRGKESKKGPSHATANFPEATDLSSLTLLPLGLEEPESADCHALWAWVSGGGCAVEAHTTLKWFTAQSGLSPSAQTLSLSITPAQTAAWRKQIFQQLTERTKRELESFQHYEQAVEQSVWVKTGALQWWCDWKPHKWVDVHVALEQLTGNDGAQDSILFIYYVVHEEKKYIHVFLNEVTALVPVFNEAKHSFALYTPERTRQRWPVRLAAATEQDMSDWLTLLNLSCCESRRLHGRPSPQAIWSVTCKGDIFVSEPGPDLEAPERRLPCDQMFWRQIGGHLRVVEANSRGVVWGIGYDHTAWVYTGGYGGGCFQGLASSTSNVFTQWDVKCVRVYENQRWNPVTGYTSRGLPTDRYMWSDATGLQECTKASTKPPSLQWTWVSDWFVDFSVPGGTDPEGWQYASDFPASYHKYKTMKDFVRRRCWARASAGCTWAPTSPSPPSPSAPATRCGPWRGTAPPSTAAPCPPPGPMATAGTTSRLLPNRG
ncbi:tectonin beta-propeller repeat-containing protein 1 isoform X4 [Dama dama]|uniref:tectonin beta-propeller repeat-containing protein 1 isoform X4 n=1 Tax=Dama dama TaxID=30532 RepID=UPI002A36B91A|nr:tectonin beta-propeller repeat-containing protein 1 isoform X4 [Dama dama]